MDKEKFDKEISKLLKNKKFTNCLIALLVVIFLWLAVSTFSGGESNNSKSSENTPNGATQVATVEGEMTSKELLSYEEKQQEELKEILGQIEGVGKVTVKIYFESGEVKVPVTNSTTQVSETQEEDRDGGTRVTTSQSDSTTVVMSNNGSSNEPVITKVYKPEITGVLVVAEGAQISKITYDIQQAVASLYNLSFDKVKVYPMAS